MWLIKRTFLNWNLIHTVHRAAILRSKALTNRSSARAVSHSFKLRAQFRAVSKKNCARRLSSGPTIYWIDDAHVELAAIIIVSLSQAYFSDRCDVEKSDVTSSQNVNRCIEPASNVFTMLLVGCTSVWNNVRGISLLQRWTYVMRNVRLNDG